MSWMEDYDYPMSESFINYAIKLHTGKSPNENYEIEKRLERIEKTLNRLCDILEEYMQSKSENKIEIRRNKEEKKSEYLPRKPKSKGVII